MTWLLLAVACSVPQLAAQNAGQDLTFQVSPAQLWTDTGLDLQSGDVLQISASAGAAAASGTPACDPAGVKTGSGQTGDQISGLPLSTAPAGALIARLHQQGAALVLVGASTELRITEPSHLFLGMNLPGTNSSTCQSGFAVKVHKGSASASSTADASQPQDRKAQLRSQLSTAAQIFMSGQFGAGKADSSASSSNAVSSSGGASGGDAATAAPLLKLSDAPLDSGLRKNLDSLPRRVNDQFQNLGDMVNFVIVGNEKDLQAALDAATWHVADTDNKKAVLNALMETYGNKDYLAMPMSTLYLFGRKQDFGYEMAEPIAMVASRHHFRIWKTTFTWNGKEVWVGAGTHDIGFAKDKRNGNVTHKIDPMVDGERDNIGNSLQKANKTKTLTYYLPPNPVQDARNATGDGYQSDGRLLVIFLQ
jgi:LssY C-terminus